MTKMNWSRLVGVIGAMCALVLSAPIVNAQTVTTAAMTGVVKDDQGAVIPGASISAVHEPSGTTYEAVTQADGRFNILGMRVGGPYKVTATLQGFTTEVKNNITLQLGVAQDVAYTLKVATVSETITVVGQSDPVFSSSHTGAATAVMFEVYGKSVPADPHIKRLIVEIDLETKTVAVVRDRLVEIVHEKLRNDPGHARWTVGCYHGLYTVAHRLSSIIGARCRERTDSDVVAVRILE